MENLSAQKIYIQRYIKRSTWIRNVQKFILCISTYMHVCNVQKYVKYIISIRIKASVIWYLNDKTNLESGFSFLLLCTKIQICINVRSLVIKVKEKKFHVCYCLRYSVVKIYTTSHHSTAPSFTRSIKEVYRSKIIPGRFQHRDLSEKSSLYTVMCMFTWQTSHSLKRNDTRPRYFIGTIARELAPDA